MKQLFQAAFTLGDLADCSVLAFIFSNLVQFQDPRLILVISSLKTIAIVQMSEWNWIF